MGVEVEEDCFEELGGGEGDGGVGGWARGSREVSGALGRPVGRVGGGFASVFALAFVFAHGCAVVGAEGGLESWLSFVGESENRLATLLPMPPLPGLDDWAPQLQRKRTSQRSNPNTTTQSRTVYLVDKLVKQNHFPTRSKMVVRGLATSSGPESLRPDRSHAL